MGKWGGRMNIINMNEWMMCISSNLRNTNKNYINLEVNCSLVFIIQNKQKDISSTIF